MGYSAYTHLIVGARVSSLIGDIKVTQEEKPLTDQFGTPTGKVMVIERKYAIIGSGIRIEIGNNLNSSKRMTLDLSTFTPDDPVRGIGLFTPDAEGLDLSTAVYGTEISDGGGSNDVKIGNLTTITQAMAKLKEYYSQRFLYRGEIQIFSLLRHSY